jgi:hypothetical protein
MCGVISTMWVTSSPAVRDDGAEFRTRIRACAY